MLAACSSKPSIVEHTLENNPLRKSKIFVASHGWHTGFILPSTSVNKRLAFLQDHFDNAAYYEFGWGDKGFYQAEEITSGLTMQAILWPTESVMHVVAIPVEPRAYFPSSEMIEIALSHSEFASLQKFIDQSFYRDAAGDVVILKNGIYGDSQFYSAVGDYYLMNTCNKWTAKGLKSAGLDIDTTFSLTAESIMSYLREQNKSENNNIN